MGFLEYVPLALLLLPLTWLWVRQNTMQHKLNDTFSKNETEKMIDLKQAPINDALSRNSEVCGDLAKALTELRVELARLRGKEDK